MRNFLFLTAATSMAILSGCSDSNASQRVDFPRKAGEYVQLYKDGESGPIKIEVARVDGQGNKQITKGVVTSSGDHLKSRLREVEVTFDNCGLYKLDQPNDTAANVYFREVERKGVCELGYMPDMAIRVTAKP